MAPYRSKNRKNRPFEPTPLLQIALARGDPLRILWRVIPRQRVKSCGYQMVKKSWRRFDTIPSVTDRQPDSQPDGHVAVPKTRTTQSVARVKRASEVSRMLQCSTEVSVELVEKCLHSLHRVKAFGPDDLSAEHLVYAHPGLTCYLLSACYMATYSKLLVMV